MKHQTLRGLRVLNTRPSEQGRLLSDAILRAGGIAVDFPTLSIEKTPTNWLDQLPNLNNVKHAIFVSINAVNHFFSTLTQQNVSWPTTIQITTVGKASSAALKKWGINVHHLPIIANSEHILQLEAFQDISDQTILLVKGEGGRIELANTLLQRGARLLSINVYRRSLPTHGHRDIHSLWQDGLVDIILFTSQQAIDNFFILVGEDAHDWLRKTPCLVISERLAEAAALLGIQTIIISRYDAIIETLEHYNKGLFHDKQQ